MGESGLYIRPVSALISTHLSTLKGAVMSSTNLSVLSTAGMMAVPMPTPEPTPLAKGAKGDGVREVQEALRAYGFMTGSADGDFG